jgi:hypothetical protein
VLHSRIRADMDESAQVLLGRRLDNRRPSATLDGLPA